MPASRLVVALVLVLSQTPAMAIDIASLWDFSQPELSEKRFRAALASVTGDDALILRTQIARTYGLRRDFARATEMLQSIEPQVRAAGPEARVRYQLELGRTLSSGAHAPESQTSEVKARARAAYDEAFRVAKAAGLDGLAIDALHMQSFVDTAPADQLKWDQQALAMSLASTQPAGRKWEASLRNNTGYALHQLGRYDEALAQFQQAVVLREQGPDGEARRSAHWMVAWTLRALGRADEALAIQLRLERECDAAGMPDGSVFEELEILYRARGDTARADAAAERAKALTK